MNPWSRPDDQQFLHQVRRQVEFWDRWRYVILVGSVIVLLGFVALPAWTLTHLSDTLAVGSSDHAASQSYHISALVGFFVGTSAGLHLHAIIRASVNAVTGGYRAERMLLRAIDTQTVKNRRASSNK